MYSKKRYLPKNPFRDARAPRNWYLSGVHQAGVIGEEEWDWGNPTLGYHNVTLKIQDSNGNTDTVTTWVKVTDLAEFYGVVEDGQGNRLENVTVNFYWEDIPYGSSYTNENGEYVIKDIGNSDSFLLATSQLEVMFKMRKIYSEFMTLKANGMK